MTLKLRDLTEKADLFSSGHGLCAGCAEPIVVREVLAALQNPPVLSLATGCLEVATTRFPHTAWKFEKQYTDDGLSSGVAKLYANVPEVDEGVGRQHPSVSMEKLLSHVKLDHDRRWPAAVTALAVFGTLSYALVVAFENFALDEEVGRTGEIGTVLFDRFVIPFEAVSFLLLAALIGGIVLARRDPEPEEETA